METILICKWRDDGGKCNLETVESHEIPIKVCVMFYITEICYGGGGE